MQTLVKTTITLPEDLLQQAKIRAIHKNVTLSQLIRNGLAKEIGITTKAKPTPAKDPLRHLGVFKLGIKSVYTKRSEIYDDHLKRNMGV